MSDVTGKGASLEEATAVLTRWVNGEKTTFAEQENMRRYVACVLAALTPPTEPPSAGREGDVAAAWANYRATAWGGLNMALRPTSEESFKAGWRAAAPSPEPQPSVRLDREEAAFLLEHVKVRLEARADTMDERGITISPGLTRAILQALAKADAIISSARSGGE